MPVWCILLFKPLPVAMSQKNIFFSFYIFVSLLLRTLTFMRAWVKCIPGPLLLCANTCHRAALRVIFDWITYILHDRRDRELQGIFQTHWNILLWRVIYIITLRNLSHWLWDILQMHWNILAFVSENLKSYLKAM